MDSSIIDSVAKSYQEQMVKLAATHEAQMQKMQESLEALGREADEKIRSALAGREGGAIKETSEEASSEEEVLKPSAAWIVAQDGEHLLVLNQVAVAMQVSLLNQVANVIVELQKLAPKKSK